MIPVNIMGSPYYKGVALPRITIIHRLGKSSRIAQWSEHATVELHRQCNKFVMYRLVNPFLRI